GRPPALDHRPRRRRPADRKRGRNLRRRAERRDLQLPGAAPRARARRSRLPDELRHGGAPASLRARRAALSGAAPRHVRRRVVGLDAAAAAPGTRPLRHQAALLPRARRGTRVRVGAARAPARGDRPRRARGVPRVQLDPRAVLDLPRRPQAAGRVRAAVAGARRDHADALRTAGARAGRRAPVGGRGRARRGAARAAARLVAERYGTEHHELLVQPDPLLLLPALAEAFDEPFADSSALPTYLVSQLASEHVKVALSGEGGDELFGGYYTYAADLLADRLAPLARVA